MGKKLTQHAFVESAKSVHGDKYDYTESDYKSSNVKIKIICNLNGHGVFWQTPSSHIHGKSGCPACGGCLKLNTESFIDRATQVHNDKYDYAQVDYSTRNSILTIICRQEGHGEFSQVANSHLQGQGCPKCKGTSNERFVAKAKLVHGDLYDYKNVEYENAVTNVEIICRVKDHGVFYQLPYNHYAGKGCPKCANNIKLTQQQFVDKANKVHNFAYNYKNSQYINDKTHVEIICTNANHGSFWQTPTKHVWRGDGCPKCSVAPFSKSSIEYLNFLNLLTGNQIVHAGNGGEYKIPNTLWKVDGYCHATNTVYEFHGSDTNTHRL